MSLSGISGGTGSGSNTVTTGMGAGVVVALKVVGASSNSVGDVISGASLDGLDWSSCVVTSGVVLVISVVS